MKIKVDNYTFDASEKKVTFTDYNPLGLQNILLITNTTDNIIIYNFSDPAYGGAVATNVLTLTYNTASMDDADKLLIYYDDSAANQRVVNKSPTGTLTNVASSASNVTLLAANALRTGATIWNDSTAILYVKLGATASATSCTVKMIADSYFEVPYGYYGIIDGIWASATGSARITETV